MNGRRTIGVNRENLAIFDVLTLIPHARNCFGHRHTALHQIKGKGTQTWIGDILAGHGADPGARI